MIWDLSRQNKSYLTNVETGILVFDVTNRTTFENIRNFYSKVKKNSPEILLIIVGNKVDLIDKRKVKPEEGEKLAKELNSLYIEISALIGENADKPFNMLTHLMLTQENIKN